MKKIILLSSGFISVFLVAVGYFGTYKLCGYKEGCADLLHNLFVHLLPIFPLFVFSCLTYLAREQIYRAWFKFSLWWIPISIGIIFLLPEYSSDWMFRFEKGTGALLMSGLFVLISILIIVIKGLRSRK